MTSGRWLLLDELNLAPDTVLQAIECALDTRELVVTDTSSASNPVRRIRQHEDFRLYATQNPNSGYYKGKRESLSTSFLSHFQPLEFRELPAAEWVEVVQAKLKALRACVATGTILRVQQLTMPVLRQAFKMRTSRYWRWRITLSIFTYTCKHTPPAGNLRRCRRTQEWRWARTPRFPFERCLSW